MKALIQRVSSASVEVNGALCAEIDRGLLVLLGVEQGDDQAKADWMVNKLLNYRVFPDELGKMNCNLQQIEGALLLVSQFTLAADTNSGNRPSFTPAADPLEAERWYEYVKQQLSAKCSDVQSGIFAADMKVSLVNDGPVTFLLEK